MDTLAEGNGYPLMKSSTDQILCECWAPFNANNWNFKDNPKVQAHNPKVQAQCLTPKFQLLFIWVTDSILMKSGRFRYKKCPYGVLSQGHKTHVLTLMLGPKNTRTFRIWGLF